MSAIYCERTREVLEHIAHYRSFLPKEDNNLWDLWYQIIDQGTLVFDRKNMRGHVTASMMLLNPQMTHTLLIYHLHHKIWLAPGGHIEEGNILENAVREAQEETGAMLVTPLARHPIHIDTHPITARPAKNEGKHWHHDLLFLGMTQDKDLAIQESEIGDMRWVPLEEVAQGKGHAAKGAQNAMKLIPILKEEKAA